MEPSVPRRILAVLRLAPLAVSGCGCSPFSNALLRMQAVVGASYFSNIDSVPLNRALSELLQESKATYEKVWCSILTPLGPVVACTTAEGSVVLTTPQAPRSIVVTTAVGGVTHVAIGADGAFLNVFVGEESGALSICTVHLKNLQVHGENKVPLPSGIPISKVVTSKKGTDVWIVQSGVVSICRNNKLARETVHFALAPDATFLEAQLLNTAHGGADAALAVSFTSPNASGIAKGSAPSSSSAASSADGAHILVYMIDLKNIPGPGQEPLLPILEFPFAPSGRSGNSSGGSGFSLFAFGRSPQKNQQGQRERPVRCEVDPDSVRSSRGGAYSFTVHVQGDNGTELSASYVSPQHKALDRLSAGGCEIFSRPCSTLADANPLDLAVHVVAGEDAVQPPHQPSTEGTQSLWRAILKLGVLPNFRADCLQEQVNRLDATAAEESAAQDSDDRGRYFVVARAVLVEAALAAGLDHLVAAYAVQQSTDPTLASGYLLEDVRRFHEGLVGAGSSVQAGLESALRALCGGKLVHGLLAESEGSFSEVVSELKQLQDVAAGLQLVTEALLSRKVQALADHGAAGHDEEDGAMDTVLQSVIAEGQSALQVQIAELRCLQRVIAVLIEVAQAPGLSFRSLLTGGLHQRSTSGKVRTASSSSAAAATAMLSEYHYTRAQRAEGATQRGDLPESLRAGPEGLLGVLCGMLLPGCQSVVEFMLHSGGSAVGVNLSSVVEAITAVLLLPFSALRQAANSSGSSSAVDPSALSNASTVAFSVVVFFLAEMQHLSAVDGEQVHGADSVSWLVQRVCSAAGVANTVRNGVLALWQIEAGHHVAQAVSTICRIQDCTISQDEVMLCAVIRHLLSASHLSECQVLLNFLRRSDHTHTIIGTEFFVLATAVAVSRADQWKMCWYSAKELSYQVRGEGADDDRGSNLRRQLVQLFVQHAMQHDAMGELLNSPLDKEEVREVEVILRALAESDVQNGRSPSPAVDVCVAFLLRETKFEDALELHERHASALNLGSQGGEWVESAKVQLEDRRALVLAHASVPTIPVQCFRS